MKGPINKFVTLALAGYATVIVVLGAGVVLALQRLNAQVTATMSAMKAQEDEITAIEHLRWTGELLVSAGRGYLLSGDDDLLGTLNRSRARLREALQRLKATSLTPAEILMVDDVEERTEEFTRNQDALLHERAQLRDPAAVIQGFETRLRPAQLAMGEAFNRLVAHKRSRLDQAYAGASRERAQLLSWTDALLVLVVILALAIAWLFTRRLTVAYGREQAAVENARRALTVRDDLMAIVAHDLRNPLGAITMKAALIRRGAQSERIREQAASIESVSDRMAYLIRSLLDVSSIETGRFTVSPCPCGVDEIIHDTLEVFAAAAAAKPVSIRTVVRQPELAIQAERERILQVLSNLVGNAMKFTPPGGQIEILAEPREDVVAFTVKDTGAGIDPEHLEHVFDRFWKHDKGGTRGTGLGLFIAKGIVEAHGGRIWANSVPGHGSTFVFEVPRAASQATVAVSATSSPSTPPLSN